MTTKARRLSSLIPGTNTVTRRSFVAGSAALAAAGGLIRGTSARQTSQSPSGDLLMWAYPLVGMDEDGKMWDSLVEGFNAQYPDVKVSIELQPWTGGWRNS